MKIVDKIIISENVKKIVVEAPLIARKTLPGQFVMLMVNKEGERIPLTIVDKDEQKGTITLIFQEVGYTTKMLGLLNKGDSLYALVGPLGHPTIIENFGKVIVLGGGVGIAELLPVIKALKSKGCHVTSILGGRTKDLVILKDQIKEYSDVVYITTDDGSEGEKGLVTDPLKRLIAQNSEYKLVFCVGPIPMMKAIADITRETKIKTIVCLNAIMIDGTGMCGCCRVTVAGRTKFTCVDGPDFDAHEVDFVEFMKRDKRFQKAEKDLNCKLDIKLKKD